MTTKLALFNDTLLILGSEKLASLAETGTRKNALDDAYDKALSYCLEQGFWNFAMRAVRIDRSETVTPTFGYTYAFTKPADFIRLHTMGNNSDLKPPLFDVVDEPYYWFTNCDPLYVKYVSNDSGYGLDLSIWPETFANYVALHIALKTCKRITGSAPSDEITKSVRRALADARSKDAMNEPPGILPTNSWVNSRGRGGNANRSRETFS